MTPNSHRLPQPEYNNEHLALLPETFTKAMIGVLISCGVIVIGMQSYVYYNFTQVYDGNSLPSSNYASSWAVLYTVMAMSSGSANALIGFFLSCVIRAKRRLMMIFGTIATFLAGVASALAGLCAIAELIKLYNDKEIPQHVCVGAADYEPFKSTCVTWWWLELMVVIFSGLALIANFACFVVLCVDIWNGNYYKELQQTKLHSVESSTSVSTVIYSLYGDHSTKSGVMIPRINSVQAEQHRKPDDKLKWNRISLVTRNPVTQIAEQQNPSPGVHQLTRNRPSLPIVIRKNTSSVYFY
ncbi:uncharacterized protein LOC130686816 isoform X2 [Daphnia carinata]|uniref:uncharacterized protein LOC130686816 isoform X2 n=1 Tax=Daphnia carinata TaxID=120202 RepID=UPI0028690725|nr:uncharacterized protein LOC130686816 isoform X2 [Daphnia carinata]